MSTPDTVFLNFADSLLEERSQGGQRQAFLVRTLAERLEVCWSEYLDDRIVEAREDAARGTED